MDVAIVRDGTTDDVVRRLFDTLRDMAVDRPQDGTRVALMRNDAGQCEMAIIVISGGPQLAQFDALDAVRRTEPPLAAEPTVW